MSLIDRLEEGFDLMQANKKWPTYQGEEIDRNDYLSSSEALRCLRHSYAEKNGVAKDEDYEEDWGFANRGHAIEAMIVSALQLVMDEDEELAYTGDEQRSFNDPASKVSATPDGIYILADEDTIESSTMIEVKSVDPRTNWDNLPRSIHIAQCGIAMGLVRRLTNLTPGKTRLIYVDASQMSKQAEYIIEWDEGAALKNAEERAKKLFSAKAMLDLPAEGAFDGGCKFCPYKTACGAAGEYAAKPKPKNGIPKDVSDVEAQVIVTGRQYIAAKTRMDMAKEMVGELKKELLDLMDGEAKVTAGSEIELKATKIAPRVTLQRDKLEERFGDLSEFEKVGAPSVRFSVKDISA